MSYGIPGKAGAQPAGNGIPVTTGFAASQQSMQAASMLNNGQPDPDILVKSMFTQSGSSSYNWASYNQAQTKTPLDGIASAMGASQSNEDVYYKQQVKHLAAQIFMRMTQEVNARSGNAGEKLMRGLEFSKFGYLQSDTHRYVCQVRSNFVELAKNNRPLVNTIGRNAAMAAISIAGQASVADPNVNFHVNTIYGYFEQWVINFTMLEMVNWINNTDQGRLIYNNCRTKELEQTLGTLEQVIGCVGSLFSWFGLDNPYDKLQLTTSAANSTAINKDVIPRGLEEIMSQSMGMYQNNVGQPNNTPSSGNMSQDDFLRRQMMLYSGQETQQSQPTYPSWDTPVQTYDTSPVRVGGRTDYKYINPQNMKEFDLTFLIPVPYENPDFKGKVYVTRDPAWNLVKYNLDYAYPDPKRWSGDWVDSDMFYLVVFNERNQWYEQIVNTRDKDWMTSKIISDPERLLPDLVLDSAGQLTLNHTKELEPLATNKFSEVFKYDELNIAKVVKEIDFEQGGAIILDDSVMKTPAMQVVNDEVEDIAGKLRNKIAADDVAIYMKPVVNISKKVFSPDDRDEVMSFARNINLFWIENKEPTPSIVDVISALNDNKERMKMVSETVYDFIVEKLTRGLNRWLVEKRGYLGLNIGNCVDEFQSIMSMLHRVGDRSTFDLLKNAKDHEWIFGVARDIHEKLTGTGFDEDPSITMVKEVIVNRIVNYPNPEFLKETFVIKRSEFPELFLAYERSNELAEESFRGQHDVLFAFDDGQWWSFTTTDIDENTAVMRRLQRKGSLVDWKLGLSY